MKPFKEDRKTRSNHGYKHLRDKFVINFLDTSHGIDLWRHLHPVTNHAKDHGHTRFSHDKRSSARLDYFLLSHPLVSNASAIEMEVCARGRSLSDHCRISCHVIYPGLQLSNSTRTSRLRTQISKTFPKTSESSVETLLTRSFPRSLTTPKRYTT
jgi:hypothetical protein